MNDQFTTIPVPASAAALVARWHAHADTGAERFTLAELLTLADVFASDGRELAVISDCIYIGQQAGQFCPVCDGAGWVEWLSGDRSGYDRCPHCECGPIDNDDWVDPDDARAVVERAGLRAVAA